MKHPLCSGSSFRYNISYKIRARRIKVTRDSQKI